MRSDSVHSPGEYRRYIGEAVSRVLGKAGHRRSVRLVASACAFWAALLMYRCGLDHVRFLEWCSRAWKSAEKVAEKEDTDGMVG